MTIAIPAEADTIRNTERTLASNQLLTLSMLIRGGVKESVRVTTVHVLVALVERRRLLLLWVIMGSKNLVRVVVSVVHG